MNNQSKEPKGAGGSGNYPLEQYSVQPPKEEDKSPYYKSAAPSLALPKGGGALRGIDEKFSVNAVNGTASVELPLPLSPGRGGFTPALSISYSSGGGNSEFGLGWGLSLPSIQRKTDKRLPEYNDAEESDVFLLAGAEDLIPVLDAQGQRIIFKENGLSIKTYRPRIEGLFARIEFIESLDNSWWRVTTKENITTYYGLDSASRIADPERHSRIFKWLPTMVVDNKGNVQVYQYVAENFEQVIPTVYEKNRLNGTAACTNTYLKKVCYSNKTPFTINPDFCYHPSLPQNMDWHFEAVIDYGDHSETSYQPNQPWAARPDAFSSFHAGFELRTYRKARRVLMFHRFPGLNAGAPTLVRSLELAYAADEATGAVEADYIIKATSRGYKWSSPASFKSKALPAMTMSYSPLQWNTEIQKVAEADFKGAPQGLTGPYQWIDLDGEGISGILSEQEGGWLYKHNLGNGHFDIPRQVAEKPSFSGLGSALQFQDLDGDGRRQVVETNKGFWQLDGPDAYTAYKRDWAPYCPFEQVARIDWESPFTKMLDLNGDGKADVLITEDRAWTWWENRGKQGFDIGGHSPVFQDEEKGPVLLLRDSVQSIFLADINGDGLTDLVRVRNGEICYWPNKGYGRFGAKVSMENAPVFDQQDAFNPQYISLSDISGTGAADIIYTGKNSCTAYINYSGNAWGEAVHINPLPATDGYSKLAVMDFLGKGTGCLVWSSPLAAHAEAPLQYIDLMEGLKPHLMVAYENGMGKVVSLEYKSSTQYYLEDKQAGIRWASRLPFPVQCVEKVTTYDKVSDSRFSQTYRYRHGYYDHEEREFRGFGYVETIDIDSVDHTAGSLDQDPVLTKSWYHTGAWLRGDALHTEFAKEYLPFEGWDTPLEDGSLLPVINIDTPGLNVNEQREAYRALKGSPLRQEVYALPAGMEPHIYTVTAFAYTVKCIQRSPEVASGTAWLAPKQGSFMNLQQQQIAFSCEGNKEDPRISHSFVLATDQYGQVERQASVAYGRKRPDDLLPEIVKQEQAKIHITCSLSRYTNGITNQALNYRLPLPYEQMAYELKMAPPAGVLYTLDELKNATFYTRAIDFSDIPVLDTKRLLSHSRTYFYNDAATTYLALGELEVQALPYESYQRVYSPADLSSIYGSRVTTAMMEEAGYAIVNRADEGWWLSSGRALYSAQPETKFYTPERFIDPWNVETSVAFWDNTYLLPKSTTDALGNTSTILGYNWHNLQPVAMKDANNNISEILYDALGMAVAMALKGKDNGTEGDSLLIDLDDDKLIDVDGSTDLVNQAAFWQDPDTYAEELLQHASWRCVYDWSDGPARVAMIACSEHTFGASNNAAHFLIRMSYSDGLGRILMHKHNCEPIAIPPDAPPAEQTTMSWIGTGRTVYNNKGKEVMQYEPYFSTSHECDTTEQAAAQGVSPRLYYDPLGRVQETRMPDGTFSRTIWTSWHQEVYDANDTVLESWWYQERIGDGMGAEETLAAQKAAAHANTPTIVHTDSLARGFYTIQHLNPITGGTLSKIESYELLDIQGNRLMVIDAKQSASATPVACLQYRYNMLQAPCRQQSIDSGTAYTLLDVAGQALYAWDTEERRTHMVYDVLRRPVNRYMNTVIAEHWIYGEARTNAATYNMRGALWLHYDQSGKQTVERYDFKGAVRESKQQLLANPTVNLNADEGTINWSGLPESTLLRTEVFGTAVQYDGLGRPVITTDPGNNTQRMQYNRSGALQKLWLNDTPYVEDIHHDAKGQRLAIWYGNNTKTSYRYDPLTYRLRRMLTVRLRDYVIVQDLNYTYDPSGNITQITDAAQQTLFYANTVIAPTQHFTYDALYRLIEASGREQISSNNTESFDDSERMKTLGSNACRNYTQKYTYDAVGNILELRHITFGGDGSYTRSYDYSVTPNNQLDNTTMGGVTYNYLHDARGNMVALPHLHQMGWNAHNELAYIRKTNSTDSEKAWYQYAGGDRVRKYVDKGNIKEERIYLGGFEIYRKFEGSSLILERQTVHISDDSGRIAMLEKRTFGNDDAAETLVRYVYSNHLQSASLEMDGIGDIISYEEYHPYGTTAFQAKNASINAVAKRYRYTGKERDEESGLYYHGARYYIPWLCRWTAIDPMESKYAGMSPYNYSFNNPVMWNDLNGADPHGENDAKIPKGVRNGGVTGGYTGEEFKSNKLSPAKIDPKNITYNTYLVKANEIATEFFNPATATIDGTTKRAQTVSNIRQAVLNFAFNTNDGKALFGKGTASNIEDFMGLVADLWLNQYATAFMNGGGDSPRLQYYNDAINGVGSIDKKAAIIKYRQQKEYYGYIKFNFAAEFAREFGEGAGLIGYGSARSGLRHVQGTRINSNTQQRIVDISKNRILTREQRLSIFKEKLLDAPATKNPNETIQLINRSLDEVEDMYSGVPKNINAASMPNRNDGRMYGILDDTFVTRHKDGSVTAKTKGHIIQIQQNGGFSIFDKKGNLFLKKQ